MGNNGASPIPRILIVESYGNYIKSLSGHLAGLAPPPQILVAADAETAMARLQTETTDLVIVDSLLRGKMNGFDLCRALRSSASNKHLPIILLLASHLSLERCKGISAGADLLIHRPIVKEELLRMIQLLLESRSEQEGDSHQAATENPPVRRLRSVS
ncbi:MAG: response regulator [Candidatus Binatia bacterium]